MQGELNTSIGQMNTDIAGVNADAVAAAAAAAEAVPAAASATASAATAAADAVIAGDAAGEIQALYLGSKSANPTTDNQGNALVVGAMYFNTVVSLMKVYFGNSTWADAGSAVNGTLNRQNYVATAGQTVFAINYDVGFVDVYLNGVKLVVTTDFTALTGSDVTLVTGATAGDAVELIAYGAFSVADQLQISNNLSDVASAPASIVNLGINATAAELNYVSGVTSSIQTQIDSVIPSQTGNAGKYLSTDGSLTSWETLAVVGGGGTTTAVPATLTSASVAAHSLTSTGWGNAVTLPDATTLSKGVTVFAFKNDSLYDISIKNNSGQIISWLTSGDYTLCTLVDNSTANGSWDFSNKQVLGLLASTRLSLPQSTTPYDYSQCKLSNNKWFIVVKNGVDVVGIVYDKTTQAFGSPTVIDSTVASRGVRALEVSTDKVVICENSATTVVITVATISGTTITTGNQTTVTLPSSINSANECVFVPINGSFIWSSYSSTQNYVFAVSVSGTTPSAGSIVSNTTTGASFPAITNYSAIAAQFMMSFYNGTGTVHTFQIYTVSGNTLTLIDTATIVASDTPQYIFPELSDNRTMVRLKNGTDIIYGIITQTASSISISTSTFTPADTQLRTNNVYGWALNGNVLMAVVSDNANKYGVEVCVNTAGVASTSNSGFTSNYGIQLLGGNNNNDAIYIINTDFQDRTNQIIKITVDGSNNPVSTFLAHSESANDVTRTTWLGLKVFSENRVIANSNTDSATRRFLNGLPISKTHYKCQESSRYNEIMDQQAGENSAFWDAEKEVFVVQNSKNYKGRNLDRVKQNLFDGDFSEGWDMEGYQYTDVPNTYSIWLSLRKIADA